MDDTKAQDFAQALTELCRQHGVMIWTGISAVPIMATAVADDAFHYLAERPEIGDAVIIRRVLGAQS